MKTLLKLNTSLYSDHGQSSRLADEFVAATLRRHPQLHVIVRDLALNAVPHLTAERFEAFNTKPESRTPEQQAVVDYSDGLIDELKRADTIVLGLPMYNFGVPSMLKAYFDHIARASVTFRYTEKGSIGLLTGKKAYVFAARGGKYLGTPMDSQTTYVRQFLAFLGITDVEFVYAEGLAMGEPVREKALAGAKAAARSLAGEELAIAA